SVGARSVHALGCCAIPAHAGWHGDEDPFQGIEVVAKIASVTDADGIALAAFDCGGDGFSADGRFDNVVDVANGEAIASSSLAVGFEIEKVAARGALGEGAASVRKIGQGFFDLHCDILDRAEI